MPFDVICENKILVKISELTVKHLTEPLKFVSAFNGDVSKKYSRDFSLTKKLFKIFA